MVGYLVDLEGNDCGKMLNTICFSFALKYWLNIFELYFIFLYLFYFILVIFGFLALQFTFQKCIRFLFDSILKYLHVDSIAVNQMLLHISFRFFSLSCSISSTFFSLSRSLFFRLSMFPFRFLPLFFLSLSLFELSILRFYLDDSEFRSSSCKFR